MPKLNLHHIDWLMLGFVLPIIAAGLITMKSFVPLSENGSNYFASQLVWVIVSLIAFFTLSFFDFRFLKKTNVLVSLYGFFLLLLVSLFVFGSTVKGATSWFDFGAFSFQPVDFVKIIIILMLAKYFSRRHVEIAHPKHIFISAIYAMVPFLLVFIQPDFGSALIIFFIWLGVTLVSGISKKHLLIITGLGAVAFFVLWTFIFQDYQKSRIKTFLDPLADIQGVGYNAYQSTIAVGSGGLFGKAVGYGTQSRLNYLPEYETDFIFAAFSEEWGFVGSFTILILYTLLVYRILRMALYAATNFEMLFGVGVATMIIAHTVINIGMNIGLMPVTGITLPFMSYGGTNLLTLFICLGIMTGMNKYARAIHREDMHNEFLGI